VSPESQRQRIAAYGICRDDEGSLLLARASAALSIQGRWFLPGGGVQHGESPLESLCREVEEESGLRITPGPLFDILSDVRSLPDGTSLHTVRLVYEVDAWSGTLRAEENGTTDAVGWFTLEEVEAMPLAHYARQVAERLW
jgi:8-oxo-dGTP diphosphatase